METIKTTEEHKRTRTPKYSTEEARHQAILEAKRRYYKRNADLNKLKASRVYYKNLLSIENLEEEKRKRYKARLDEVEAKIKIMLPVFQTEVGIQTV